ncbi:MULTISPECIES: response regulator [Limibacillus]|uniref:histidine kinase n=1 Tax=Limibacillus halophilus TaxID=1579333 RepID=A0A839STG1_9PROT|nr:response regulator [Limibacillus halophilus]MBB3064666.1 CheY-like chemotaxis protein [Limibacillus halophilus]
MSGFKETDQAPHVVAEPQWEHRAAFTKLADELAHDFNNVLTSIMGSTEILRGRMQCDMDDEQELDTIRKEAERAAHILRRLTASSDRALLTEAVQQNGALDEEQEKEMNDAAQSGAIRVLLAEDDDSVRSCASLALRRAGYHVTACASGVDAWDVFQMRPASFHLLVTDLSMPVLDGASLIQRARLLRPRLRVLLISGYCDDRIAFDLISRGEAGFLPKPFALKQLLDHVRGQLSIAA